MPKGVYQRKSRRNKREEILTAATRVYAHYGFEGATIEHMAQAAGVSKALVLNYFPSKQDLVRAIADRAVEQSLQKIYELDTDPNLTLHRREWLVHDLVKQQREEWCLVLGTVLVPSFAFQARGQLGSYLEAGTQAALTRREELRTPTPEAAQGYAYTALCLHIGYLVGGQEDTFSAAMRQHQGLYLLGEAEHKK